MRIAIVGASQILRAKKIAIFGARSEPEKNWRENYALLRGPRGSVPHPQKLSSELSSFFNSDNQRAMDVSLNDLIAKNRSGRGRGGRRGGGGGKFQGGHDDRSSGGAFRRARNTNRRSNPYRV